MMKIKTLLAAITILLISGCATTKMVVASNQEMLIPDQDTSQVIFLRSSFVGSAIQASVFDVTTGEPDFIGILSNESKLAWTGAPGQHVFMVVSEAADFMEANLDGGKSYYAMVTPRMGAWKARFSMHPVRASGGNFQHTSDEFKTWLENSNFVENTPESEAWFNENRDSIKSKQADYWAVWQKKTDADRAERTLNAEDGI
jgi:hypothetical protein